MMMMMMMMMMKYKLNDYFAISNDYFFNFEYFITLLSIDKNLTCYCC